MDRPIIYTQEGVRGYDLSKGWQDSFKAIGENAQGILGSTATLVFGLAGTQSSPASLVINIGAGGIFQYGALDPNPEGDLPADGNDFYLAGFSNSSQALTLTTSALASGQSQWVLVQAAFAFNDVIRNGDPLGGILPFYNSANPTQPLQGQGGSGATLPTEHQAIPLLSLVYGTPATTGSQTAPSATTGNVGLYLILLTYGQTTITTAQILVAGPSVGTGVSGSYPQAPFIAGLLNQHHLGIAGQAPQIDLTAEVKNVLPNANTTGATTATANTLALRDGSGDLTATQFNVSSQRKLKRKVRRIGNALKRLSFLRGVTFERRDTGRKEAGLIAEDMQAALAYGSNGETINPMAVIALLVESVLRLKARLEKLEKR